MFILKIENKIGNVFELTQNESNYQIVNVEGLEPPNAQIYTNAVANMDGEKFKSSKLDMRNLVLTVQINGNAEANRINLYRYFGAGKWCKIYYKNDTRDTFIEGYVEAIECPLFEMNQQMQVSIVCPTPYFKSVEIIYTDISVLFSKFSFPFSINETGTVFSELIPNRVTPVINDGEFETGFEIVLHALADGITNPIIYNADTGEYLSVNVTINEGEIVRINTNKGSKSIVKIVDGDETNIINSLDYGSTWLQLETGSNNFTYDTNKPDKLQVIFEYHYQYEGV